MDTLTAVLCTTCTGSGAVIENREDTARVKIVTCPRCKGGCVEARKIRPITIEG